MRTSRLHSMLRYTQAHREDGGDGAELTQGTCSFSQTGNLSDSWATL